MKKDIILKVTLCRKNEYQMFILEHSHVAMGQKSPL